MSDLPKLAALRQEYTLHGLRRSEVDSDPVVQFGRWFDEARGLITNDPNAMTVATATLDGRPSVRTILLKDFNERGFTFFTNYESRKGRELAANPRAALLFHWKELERQIVIEGSVTTVPRELSVAYFHARPRGSQLGAAISQQSHPVLSRGSLERSLSEAEELYGPDKEIPTPEHWGGYLVTPDRFEFWQGRVNRLHDRIEYLREASGSWKTRRLSP
jgi:pyridoxamine 5'-phosphate oxidase